MASGRLRAPGSRQGPRLVSSAVLVVALSLVGGPPPGGEAAEGIALARSPWPMYRGDLQRTERSPVAGPKTSRLRWVFSTGRAEKEGGIETDPVLGPDGTVYLGANNGIFYALDQETGAVRWVFPTRFDIYAIYSSPFVDRQGIVYFGAKDGHVYAVRAPRQGIMGELVWSINLGTTIQTSPAFTPDGTLVIGADDWAYYGISPPQKGKGPEVKWRFQTQGTLITSPAVDAEGTVYVASMDGKAYAFHDTQTALAPDATSLTRTWYGQVRVGDTEESLVAVLVQRGSDVDGVVRLKSGLRGPVEGKLQGSQGTFTLSP